MVDEVLAVGDAQFQEKCLGRMRAVTSTEGRTVIFVSHHAGAVRQLCEEAVLFESGRVCAVGPTEGILKRYLGGHRLGSVVDLSGDGVTRGRSKDRVFRRLEFRDEAGRCVSEFEPLSVMRVRLELELARAVELPGLTVRVNTARGERLYVLSSLQGESAPSRLGKGRCVVECRMIVPPLVPGVYGLEVALAQQYWRTEYVDEVVGGIGFEVLPAPGGVAVPLHDDPGNLLVRSEWSVINPDALVERDDAA
jgi:lipopolysaccharide transport system ATP-binding protein